MKGLLDKVLFDSYWTSYKGLATFRIVFGSTFLLIIGVPQFGRFASFPDVYFHPPPGVPRLFDSFLSASAFAVFDILLLASLLLLLIGYKTRIASITFSLLLMLGIGFGASTGKVSHNGVLTWFVPLLLCGAWGKAYSVDSARKSESADGTSWPVAYLALILGFSYFTAGIQKVAGGWLRVDTSHFHGLLMDSFVSGRESKTLSIIMDMPLWLAEGMDWMVIIFEIGFLFAVLSPKLFRVFTLIAIVFHLSVMYTMNITFDRYWIFYLVFWADYFKIRAWKWKPIYTYILTGAIICYVVCFYTIYKFSLYRILWGHTSAKNTFVTILFAVLFLVGSGLLIQEVRTKRKISSRSD